MTYSEFDHLEPWKFYIVRIIIALDQLFNTLIGGFPDETISGKCGRAMKSGCPKWFVPPLTAVLDCFFEVVFNQKNHCEKSIEPEDRFDERPEIWKWSKDCRL